MEGSLASVGLYINREKY